MKRPDRFYVYALIDPRDGEVFYVGKGSGQRAHQHVRAVRYGRADANKMKRERIRSILDAQLEPFVYVVASEMEEQAAIDVEHKLIMGLHRLTNIVSIGWARSPAEIERLQQREHLRYLATAWRQRKFSAQRAAFKAIRRAGLRLGFYWPQVPSLKERAGKWEDLTEVVETFFVSAESRLQAAGYSREWIDGGPY